MRSFDSDGVEIAYMDEGSGEPILLLHGFASNVATNWIDTGWVDTLTGAGRRVIALDARGHGASQKLYDKAAYPAPVMAEDARRLLAHLDVAAADVMGYSMGARIAAFMALAPANPIRKLVVAGLGYNMVRGMGAPGPIAHALEAPSIDDVTNKTARTFRAFAESTGSDLKALAACIRAAREKIDADALSRIRVPVLVAVGTEDVIAGSAAKLAALMPHARVLAIPRRDHMKAVGDRVFKEGVLEFLRAPAGRHADG